MSLRARLTRLAHATPEMRPAILAMLRRAGGFVFEYELAEVFESENWHGLSKDELSSVGQNKVDIYLDTVPYDEQELLRLPDHISHHLGGKSTLDDIIELAKFTRVSARLMGRGRDRRLRLTFR